MTNVIKVVNYHNCYSAQNVPAIITVTAVHLLFVLQSLSGWAGNVLSVSLVRLAGEFLNTVEPLLSGHPQGNGRWLHNTGWCTLNIFHHRVNFLVNMASLQGNMINVCLNLFITRHLSWTLICHCLFQNKVFKFWVAV